MKLTIVTIILLMTSTSFALTQPQAPAPSHDQICTVIAEDIQMYAKKIQFNKAKLEELQAMLNFDDTPGANLTAEMYLQITTDIEKTENRITRHRGAVRALLNLSADILCD